MPIDLATIGTGDGSQGFVLRGVSSDDYSGASVSSAGDINGDGFDDVIVGAPGVGPNNYGASYVVFGKAGGFGATIELQNIRRGDGTQGFFINGEEGADRAGFSVSSAGDLNGDGFDDVIVGAPGGDGFLNGSPAGAFRAFCD